MINKKLVLTAVLLTIGFLLSACRGLDVIGNGSAASFGKVLEAAPDMVAKNEAAGGWALAAPDAAAHFVWSADFRKSSGYDAFVEFDAQPFIEAGLDIDSLPEGIVYKDGMFIVGAELSEKAPSYEGEATPAAAYGQIVENSRESIKYHSALDHYGIDLGSGNMFEWAKDISTNDKDIVFVLNPRPFIEAGVDPDKVAGWLFAKVEVMDMSGKALEVEKFLKPFDLS